MNIVQITPGAGGMYCGNCFRDNALVAAFRRLGHSTLMVPLYLPMTLEEDNQSAGTPVFFSGVNVYLEQKSAFFRHMPRWLHQLLATPRILKWAAGKAAKTRAADVGDLTLSMLRGEEGNQARELDELITWLRDRERPDVVCLSNALLIGLVRRLKSELNVPVICMLQGEDTFLDALPVEHRDACWRTLSERAREVDQFVAPSHYFAETMASRLNLPAGSVHVAYNGINLDGYTVADQSPQPPVLGYFARMCGEKGLDTLVEAYLHLRKRNRIPNLKLKIGGGCGPSDKPFVEQLRNRLREHHVLGDVEFHPNLTREQKLAFFRTLTVFSVPALYGEAFGLYVIEALAAGVPVVKPRHAAFPELIRATGGGVICEPGDPSSLADAIEDLLLHPDKARALGEAGRKAVLRDFNIDRLARDMIQLFHETTAQMPRQSVPSSA
ncbi:MAG TPA: glycosyltransferase family 4 protein [Methylomirabilota bacterium]|nr:glycosyltransferase family 4 protein [Methylomirabilota bacterium]